MKLQQILSRKLEPALRIIVSVWAVYHLACIVILPNGVSFLGRTFEAYILPYANQVGANNSWNFFSPDPAHTMYFEYNLYFENENGEEIKEPVQGFIPPEKTAIVLNTSERRKLYAMRFLLMNPARIEELVAPWLCRTHPGASRLSIVHKLIQLPTLDRAILGIDSPVDDMKQDFDMKSMSFDCRTGVTGS